MLSAIGLIIAVAAAVLAPLAIEGAGRNIDGLAAHKPSDITSGVWLVSAGIVMGVAQGVSSSIVWSFVNDLSERFIRHLIMMLICAISTIAHHEMPEMADRVVFLKLNARRLAAAGPLTALHLSSLIGAGTIAVVLGSITWWLPALILAAFLPAWAAGRTARARIDAERNSVQAVRIADRVLDLAHNPGTAIEIRCSAAAAALIDIQRSALEGRMEAVTVAGRRARQLQLAARLVWMGLLARSLAEVFTMVRSGAHPVGTILVLVLLVPQIEGVVSGLGRLGHFVVETDRQIECLDEVMQYDKATAGPAEAVASPTTLTTRIEVLRVSFRYPSAGKAALHDVSLHLKAGSTVALVGENGAGKSTLVKLLTRLYEPTEGSLVVEDIPFERISPRSWRQAIRAVFQDHANPQFVAHESISIGDLTNSTPDKVSRAVIRADADGVVAGLPNGLNTQLGRQFADGMDLSGGQWQRLAIARGLMRQRPVLMLFDEPSSALDPQAEDTILASYLSRARELNQTTGAITVIVSHRMSTVRLVDRIIHLHDGRVIEDGTHDELMARDGRYAEMFNLQASSYR
jgi:ATP-binding cassette subfamily B protein